MTPNGQTNRLLAYQFNGAKAVAAHNLVLNNDLSVYSLFSDSELALKLKGCKYIILSVVTDQSDLLSKFGPLAWFSEAELPPAIEGGSESLQLYQYGLPLDHCGVLQVSADNLKSFRIMLNTDLNPEVSNARLKIHIYK